MKSKNVSDTQESKRSLTNLRFNTQREWCFYLRDNNKNVTCTINPQAAWLASGMKEVHKPRQKNPASLASATLGAGDSREKLPCWPSSLNFIPWVAVPGIEMGFGIRQTKV